MSLFSRERREANSWDEGNERLVHRRTARYRTTYEDNKQRHY